MRSIDTTLVDNMSLIQVNMRALSKKHNPPDI